MNDHHNETRIRNEKWIEGSYTGLFSFCLNTLLGTPDSAKNVKSKFPIEYLNVCSARCAMMLLIRVV